MADSLGQADVRGLDIDKLIKGFADEEFVFKNFLTVTPTANREMRWFQNLTANTLDSTDTTGITASQLNSAFGTLPPIAEQSTTRMTSYAKHFHIGSPWFTYADIKDSDPDMFALNLKGLVRGIQNQVDYRILDVLSGSVLLSGSAAGTGWGDTTAGNPFLDLLSGSTEIRKKGYQIDNVVAWVSPDDYKDLFNYFITVKGASVPAFSSGKVEGGVITKIANVGIHVSNNCTVGQVMMVVPQRVATWKVFTPLTTNIEEKPGLGTQIRVWEDGEVLFTDPNAGYLIKSV